MNDALFDRLQAADPCGPDVAVDPVSSPPALELLEQIMQTIPDVPSTNRSTSRATRRWFVAGGGLVAAAAAAVGVAVVTGGGGTQAAALELALPATDPLTAMCAVFDESILATMPVAFAGTVTDVTPTQVVIEVDRWYTGGDAETVEVTVPEGFSPALDGIEFVDGERYLVTAVDGAVTSCGMSGAATPEFEQSFERAFG